MSSKNHTPTRTCVVCKTKTDKSKLMRIVCPNKEIVVDDFNKINSRGVYVCKNKECVVNLKKNRVLNKIYHKDIPTEIYDSIIKKIEV